MKLSVKRPFSGNRTTITRRARLLFTVAGIIFAVGCLMTELASGSQLACSGGKAKDLVAQIFRDERIKFAKEINDLKGSTALEDATIDIREIRTTAKDDNTGALTCAATIHTKLPAGTQAKMLGLGDGAITYHLEKTDDGRLYAEVSSRAH